METLLPEGWPRPSGYSAGMKAPPGSAIVFVAGMVAWDDRQRLVSNDFADQFEQALRNVLAVVQAAGGRAEDVGRLTVYVTDLGDYHRRLPEVGDAWRRVMGRHYPAMSLLEVKGLLEPGALVEIEATAAVPPVPAGT